MRAKLEISRRATGHSDMVLVTPCIRMTTGRPASRSGPDTEVNSLCVPMETSCACSPLFQSIASWLSIVEEQQDHLSEAMAQASRMGLRLWILQEEMDRRYHSLVKLLACSVRTVLMEWCAA